MESTWKHNHRDSVCKNCFYTYLISFFIFFCNVNVRMRKLWIFDLSSPHSFLKVVLLGKIAKTISRATLLYEKSKSMQHDTDNSRNATFDLIRQHFVSFWSWFKYVQHEMTKFARSTGVIWLLRIPFIESDKYCRESYWNHVRC